MKADSANLLRLLRKADQFEVPLYQRRYSWTEEQWGQLWADIVRVADDSQIPGHFVGSVVHIGETALAAGFNPLQLIDGQQRLTTVSLMLLALERTAQERLDAHPDDRDSRDVLREDITRDYLMDERARKDRRYKLVPNEADRATYLALIEGNPPPDQPSANVLRGYEFFRARFAQSSRPLHQLFEAMERLVVVEIALDRDRDDPQLIFESLNSTGLDLTQADLIRNHILMRLKPDEQEVLFRDYWLPTEARLSALPKKGYDRFVRDYLTMRTAEVPKVDEIYRAFKEHCARGDIATIDVAKDLHQFSEYYAKLTLNTETDPEVRTAIADINVLKVEVAYPFLLDVLDDHATGKITRGELLTVLRMAASYVFRRAIVGVPTNALNKIFASLSRDVDEANYIESLTAALLLKVGSGRFPRDEEFRNELLVKDIYSFRNRTHLLSRLENEGRKEPVDVSAYTVEHIMPQNPELPPEWQTELGPEWIRIQAEHLHSLGNLTLTGYNSEMSDRPFPAKMAMTGGFQESPLRLNESVRAYDTWNEGAITARGALLAERALHIWAFPQITEAALGAYRDARRAPMPVATLDDHPNLTGDLSVLFEELRRRIGNLSPEVSEDIRERWIAYRIGRSFVNIVPEPGELVLYLDGIAPEDLIDPAGLGRDVRGLGHWGSGDIEVRLASGEDLDEAIDLVAQALTAVEESGAEMVDIAEERIERIIQRAVTADEQSQLRRIVDIAMSSGVYPGARKRSLTFSPPQRRIVNLLTVRVHEAGTIDYACTSENWEPYANVPAERARMLAPDDWAIAENAGDLSRLADRLNDVLAEATFPSGRRSS